MGEEKPQSWWKTFPGILTAAAGFITAVSGLIVALHQAGIFENKGSLPSEPTSKTVHETPPKPKEPPLMKARDDQGRPRTYNTADFIGYWVNMNPETGITRAEIQQRLDKLVVHMWAKCHPSDCDWSTAETAAASAHQGSVHLVWNAGFAIRLQELRLLDDRRLEVITKTEITDKSGRPSYESFDYLERK
jgi:hypothetical protein